MAKVAAMTNIPIRTLHRIKSEIRATNRSISVAKSEETRCQTKFILMISMCVTTDIERNAHHEKNFAKSKVCLEVIEI